MWCLVVPMCIVAVGVTCFAPPLFWVVVLLLGLFLVPPSGFVLACSWTCSDRGLVASCVKKIRVLMVPLCFLFFCVLLNCCINFDPLLEKFLVG